MDKPTLKLKTAEERAAEIRAESDAIEAAQAAKKAEKAAPSWDCRAYEESLAPPCSRYYSVELKSAI